MTDNTSPRPSDAPYPRLPLGIGYPREDDRTQLIDVEGEHVGYVEQYPHDEIAALIVTAVNSYDAMREALKAFLRAPSVGSDGPGSVTIVVQEFHLRDARAALAAGEPDNGEG